MKGAGSRTRLLSRPEDAVPWGACCNRGLVYVAGEFETMDEQKIAERLAERRVCEAEHQALRIPHNGFGWTGTRCSRCGFMFFGEWEPGFGAPGQ